MMHRVICFFRSSKKSRQDPSGSAAPANIDADDPLDDSDDDNSDANSDSDSDDDDAALLMAELQKIKQEKAMEEQEKVRSVILIFNNSACYHHIGVDSLDICNFSVH